MAVRSADGTGALRPRFTQFAYVSDDGSSADLYLTDLSNDALEPSADLSTISGQILHLHLFMRPRAGKTPIADEACSMTVRHVILANGAIGVYGGGGFFRPAERPGAPKLSGSIREATTTLVSSTANFADRLGSGQLSGSINVPNDPALAQQIASRLREAMSATAGPDR